ncbi:MAG: Na/Pi cotransporter family protein [Acutalibacteraceae bacterium]
MDIFSLFTLFGGLAFFLYGMHVMSSGLEKMAGGKLEVLLKRMTSNPFKSLALGAGITIAIQSSSALTVMLVGLVNSGIMQLGQTVGVIMGSNIGTTLTAWILSLAGIESDNFFIELLKPESFSPLIALIGIVLIMASKQTRRRDIGGILVGFAVLMYGMELMKNAVSPLADMPEFESILTAFSNPILGVVVGAVFTGVIQSSAASVGILQALSMTGGVTYGMAIPIIMGQNIGTCVTSLISSIGVNKNAKRVAVVHICFNVIGTVFCLCVFYLLNLLFHFSFVEQAISPVSIAAVHSIFNVVTTVLLLPFAKQLEKLATLLVRDKEEKEKEAFSFLDERILRSPAFAVAECKNLTNQMALLAKENLMTAFHLVEQYDPKSADRLQKVEKQVDEYEDKLGTCLVKISSKELSDDDSKEVSKLLHSIGDWERLSDHAVNLLKTAKEIHDKKVDFSDQAAHELKTVVAALTEIIDITTQAFTQDDRKLARKVEALEQTIDGLIDQIKDRHITRLQSGECTIELGFVLSDLLTNYERISDHCSNIAVAMIQIRKAVFDTHRYLQEVKHSGRPEFENLLSEYQAKYALQA